MDVEYANKLAQCYKQLHKAVIEVSCVIEWPVCIDPRQRHKAFVEFMESLNGDEWAQYYISISNYLEKLQDTRLPKDKTQA